MNINTHIMRRRAHKINNERFSIKFCQVSRKLGLTRVGQVEDFISKALPTTKIGVGVGFVRLNALKRELQVYLNRDIVSVFPHDHNYGI